MPLNLRRVNLTWVRRRCSQLRCSDDAGSVSSNIFFWIKQKQMPAAALHLWYLPDAFPDCMLAFTLVKCSLFSSLGPRPVPLGLGPWALAGGRGRGDLRKGERHFLSDPEEVVHNLLQLSKTELQIPQFTIENDSIPSGNASERYHR